MSNTKSLTKYKPASNSVPTITLTRFTVAEWHRTHLQRFYGFALAHLAPSALFQRFVSGVDTVNSSFMRNSKHSSSTDHSPLSQYALPPNVSSLVSWPGNVLHLMSIFIVIIHRHIIHWQCLRISLRQLSLYWLAFTGPLNHPTGKCLGANVRRANVLRRKRLQRDGQTTDGQTSWGANVFYDTGKRPEGQMTRGANISLPREHTPKRLIT